MKRLSSVAILAYSFLCCFKLFAVPYTWERIPYPYVAKIKSVAIHLNGTIYIGTESGDPNLIYKTQNKGLTWTPIGIEFSEWFDPIAYQPPHIKQLLITKSGIIYAVAEFCHDADTWAWASTGGLYRSEDDGDSWDRIFWDPYGSPFYAALFNDKIYLAPNENVYFSTDNGETWTCFGPLCPDGEGTSGPHIAAFDVCEFDPGDFNRIWFNSVEYYTHCYPFWGKLDPDDYSFPVSDILCIGVDIEARDIFGTVNGVYYTDAIWRERGHLDVGLEGFRVNDFYSFTHHDQNYFATDHGIFFDEGDFYDPSWVHIGLTDDVSQIHFINPTEIIAITADNKIYLGTESEPVSYLLLTYPNSPIEILEHLIEYNITWDVTGDLGNRVKLELFRDNDLVRIIAEDTENDKVYKWFVNRDIPSDNDYRIKITSLSQQDKSDFGAPFSIIINQTLPAPKMYMAAYISQAEIPIIDGKPDETMWESIDEDTLLFGGDPGDWNTPWLNFSDNFVTWKAVWNDTSNRFYITVTVRDDIRGTFDNGLGSDNYSPGHDESIEIFTNGDCDCINYWELYGPAQFWRVTEANGRNLYNWPTPGNHDYTGLDFITEVSMGNNGDWTMEAEMILYDTYNSSPKTLTQNDTIGFDIWYNDTDDETISDGSYRLDHQIGWNYQGEVWKQSDYQGFIKLAPSADVVCVKKFTEEAVPLQFDLYHNIPNPFNPCTTIRFVLSEATDIRVQIYDLRGQSVVTLINEHILSGMHNIKWDGKDQHGFDVASGVYMGVIQANQEIKYIKMMLIR